MRSLVFTLFVSHSPQDSSELQFECMRRFLGANADVENWEWVRGLGLFQAQTNPENVCSWLGVSCENHMVSHIKWQKNIEHSYYDLNWLPSTIKEIWIDKQAIEPCPINTRMLSRSLISFSMIDCNLIGPLNIQGLPSRVQSFIVRRNMLVGTINLTYLPTEISSIDLSYNFFSEIIVLSSKLPESLVEVLGGKSKITWIDGTKDKRIRSSSHTPL